MQVCEYWDDMTCRFYRQNGVSGNYTYFEYPEVGQELRHGLGAVPFIPFYNNADRRGDLPLYRDLIDAYDKVVSGFANDMEDVQEVIFVIKNYGGTDKTEFMSDLKKSKLIKVEGDGGVDTIRAEIPFEARNAFLERTRRQIFVSGMGVDPNPENFGNSSGVALKYLYSLLELKAVMLETQFRSGFAELVRAICRLEGIAQPRAYFADMDTQHGSERPRNRADRAAVGRHYLGQNDSRKPSVGRRCRERAEAAGQGTAGGSRKAAAVPVPAKGRCRRWQQRIS